MAILEWSHHYCYPGYVLFWRDHIFRKTFSISIPNIWKPWRSDKLQGSNSNGCPGCNCSESLFFGYVLCSPLASCMLLSTSGALVNSKSQSSPQMHTWMYTMAISIHWTIFRRNMKVLFTLWWPTSIHRQSKSFIKCTIVALTDLALVAHPPEMKQAQVFRLLISILTNSMAESASSRFQHLF